MYTNATIALRPKTGELAWFFQHMPNDRDLDWVFERQIVELGIGDNSRKVVLTAGKMALFDVLDAATGEYLDSFDVGLRILLPPSILIPAIRRLTPEQFLMPKT